MVAIRRDKPWTWAEYEALPDDGVRREVIEGTLFELPRPNMFHAMSISNLIALLHRPVEEAGARWMFGVFAVFMDGAEPVLPDLVVLLQGNTARTTERGIEGPPDIVIEVLSPSNRARDVLTKRALYRRAGVREYWIVDPTALTIEVVRFRDGIEESRTFGDDERVVSAVLPGVDFPASAVFAGFDEIEAE
jgi:Uma2 family endonuclease